MADENVTAEIHRRRRYDLLGCQAFSYHLKLTKESYKGWEPVPPPITFSVLYGVDGENVIYNPSQEEKLDIAIHFICDTHVFGVEKLSERSRKLYNFVHRVMKEELRQFYKVEPLHYAVWWDERGRIYVVH